MPNWDAIQGAPCSLPLSRYCLEPITSGRPGVGPWPRWPAAGGMTNPCREPAPLRLLLLAAVAEDERATSVPWWAPTVDWGPDLDLAVTLTLARRRETAVRGATSRIRAIPAGGYGSRGPPPPPRTRRPSWGPSAGRLHGGGEPLPALLPWPLTPV